MFSARLEDVLYRLGNQGIEFRFIGSAAGYAECVCACCRPICSGADFHLLGAPAGVTQEEGQHTGDFFFFLICFWFSTILLRCLSFLFDREKGSVLPFPRRPRSRILCTHDKVALHCWVFCKKKLQITLRFEPATLPTEGYEVTN